MNAQRKTWLDIPDLPDLRRKDFETAMKEQERKIRDTLGFELWLYVCYLGGGKCKSFLKAVTFRAD